MHGKGEYSQIKINYYVFGGCVVKQLSRYEHNVGEVILREMNAKSGAW